MVHLKCDSGFAIPLVLPSVIHKHTYSMMVALEVGMIKLGKYCRFEEIAIHYHAQNNESYQIETSSIFRYAFQRYLHGVVTWTSSSKKGKHGSYVLQNEFLVQLPKFR